MGLDCTAYSNLKHVGRHAPVDDEDDDCGHIIAFAYDGFQHSTRGLLGMDKRPSFGGNSFIGGDCYDATDATQSFGWRAGSYGGYSRYREELAHLAGSNFLDYKPGAEDLPFFEQIFFADNEGTIGPEAAADLLADYRQFHDRAKVYWSGEPYSLEVYEEWITALELASQGGLVDFH